MDRTLHHCSHAWFRLVVELRAAVNVGLVSRTFWCFLQRLRRALWCTSRTFGWFPPNLVNAFWSFVLLLCIVSLEKWDCSRCFRRGSFGNSINPTTAWSRTSARSVSNHTVWGTFLICQGVVLFLSNWERLSGQAKLKFFQAGSLLSWVDGSLLGGSYVTFVLVNERRL